jgi:integrase
MASFRKRGSSWQAQVRRQGCGEISRSFKLKSDAIKWARSIETEIDEGAYYGTENSRNNVTLQNIIDRYLAEITPNKKSFSQETYRLKRIRSHKISGLPVVIISSHHIASYRDERSKTVGSQSVRHELNVISHMFNTMITEWGFAFIRNPVVLITKPKQSRPRERRLEDNEFQRLIEAAMTSSGKCLVPVIEFAIETAMRRMEILRLKWIDVDFENHVVQIAETKNGYSREVPLSKKALRMLRQQEHLCGDTVFPITENFHRYHWQRITKNAEIENLRFHDLRHEAISRFFEQGLSVAEVALISGHRDVRQLFRYTHLRAMDIVKKLK